MFCKTVWNGLHILPDGYIRLCSLGTNTKPELDMQRCRDKDGNIMHILTHDIKDIMNSDKHREVRLFNKNNPSEWSPHCECCENREIITNFDRSHKNKSRRVYLMKVDTAEIVDENNFRDRMSTDGCIDWMPSSLDIRFGNLCNQKCIMCGPVFSNMWYDEYFDYYKTNSFGQGKKIAVTKDTSTGKWITPEPLQWFEDPRWWPKFEQMMPYLKHIYITGGEPMVAPAHDIMLDKLIDAGYAKNIWLEYDTNCSAINDKIAQRWVNFKRVEIRGSMDSIEDQYEIIRYPGNWTRFTKNIEKLKVYESESNKRIELIALSSCFQISTAYSIIKSEEWCKSVDVDFHMRFLEGPAHHSISSLPDSTKLDLIDYYKKHIGKNTKAQIIVNYLQNQIGKGHYIPKAVKEFSTFMDYLDVTRNTKWREIFPEVSVMVDKVS
jgi:hypothetical protein